MVGQVARQWHRQCEFSVAIRESLLVDQIRRGLGVVDVELDLGHIGLECEEIAPLVFIPGNPPALDHWLTMLSAQAFRRLNANTVPHVVSVPKNAEEDAKRGN